MISDYHFYSIALHLDRWFYARESSHLCNDSWLSADLKPDHSEF